LTTSRRGVASCGFSAQEVRDEAISLNPWQQNEAEPNHRIAIAMEHQLLICAR
jgi:hypothetical protein